ncbi:MAG: hypothetical protein ABUL60_08435 [Myxococcales bacterium]
MLRATGLVSILALVLHACMGTPACTNAGEDVLIIPVARLSSVTGLSADGTCTVGPLPASCSLAAKCIEYRGEQAVVVNVTSSARGKCTVSVDFNDSCAAEEHHYEFIGPHENCCEDVCSRSPEAYPVASSCAK